jgi:hypothetical protein
MKVQQQSFLHSMSRLSDLVIVAVLSSGLTYGVMNYVHFSHNRLTPSELFNLRSKCSELGAKFIEGEGGDDDLALETPFYDEINNRCLVNRTDDFKGGYSNGGVTMHWLNDAQTSSCLARTQANQRGKWGWITDPKTGQQEESTYEKAESFIKQQTTEPDTK